MNRLSIFAAAREAPNRIALVSQEGKFTYAQLAGLAARRAAALAGFRGPLLLQPQLDLDSLLWLYAAFATGTPFLPLHAQATSQERAAVEARTGARHPPSPDVESASQIVERDVDPESQFSLMLTSGSSGTPKIAVLSRRAVLASAAASEHNLGADAEERWLLCLSLSHVAGLAIVVRMLAARRTVVLFESAPAGKAPASLLSRTIEVGRLIHDQQVTLVSLVPPLLEQLLRDGFQPPYSLRAVLLGGAGSSPELAERAARAGVPLITSYGLTETGSQIAARRYAERYSILPQRSGCVSSGQPLADVEIKIVGERIAVKSPALLTGYFGAAAPAVDIDGWFITSDRGAIGPQGELYVFGRTDTVIVTGGENVDPEEVERALRLMPHIRDACVFGLPANDFGQRVVAIVVPTATASTVTFEEMTQQLRLRLARFKLPRAIVFVDALPITALGKLDRLACITQFRTRFNR